MSAEQNMATVRLYFDSWNNADAVALEACFTLRKRQSDKPYFEFLNDTLARWFTAFPDYRYHVEDLLALGDTVAVNTYSTGRHDGVFDWYGYGPWPASGRQIGMREMFFIRMSGGKIAEMIAAWNADDLRDQLGVARP